MRKEKLEELNSIIENFKTKEIFENIPEDNFLRIKVRKFQLKNGKEIIRSQLIKNSKEGNSVIILPVTQEGNVILVVQPRVFTESGVGVEFPAGYVEKGEEPIESAKRELKEETGYEPEEIKFLGKFYQDQGCSGAMNALFLATGCVKKYEQDLDSDEYVKYFECTYNEMLELVELGYIKGAGSNLIIEKAKKFID